LEPGGFKRWVSCIRRGYSFTVGGMSAILITSRFSGA
jgi:hypothetical protein